MSKVADLAAELRERAAAVQGAPFVSERVLDALELVCQFADAVASELAELRAAAAPAVDQVPAVVDQVAG